MAHLSQCLCGQAMRQGMDTATWLHRASGRAQCRARHRAQCRCKRLVAFLPLSSRCSCPRALHQVLGRLALALARQANLLAELCAVVSRSGEAVLLAHLAPAARPRVPTWQVNKVQADKVLSCLLDWPRRMSHLVAAALASACSMGLALAEMVAAPVACEGQRCRVAPLE